MRLSAADPNAAAELGSAAKQLARQLVLPLQNSDEPGLGSFVPVGHSALALAHLAQLSAPAAPVYLWGPGGAGKSHLLSAAAARLRQAGAQVEWLGAQRPLPWPQAADLAADGTLVFVIDDAHALSADQQHAAFSLLVSAPSARSVVLAGGDVPPIDLRLRDDLRTRLAQGLVFELEPLDDDGVRHVLTAAAHRRGMVLSPELSQYLITHFARDLKFLMNLLDQLDRYALAQQRGLSIPLLKQMLASDAGDSAHSI